MKSGKKAQPFDYVLIVVFILIIIATVYPFLNVLAISLNDPMDTMRNVNFIIPRKFTLSNYTYHQRESSTFRRIKEKRKKAVQNLEGGDCTAFFSDGNGKIPCSFSEKCDKIPHGRIFWRPLQEGG